MTVPSWEVIARELARDLEVIRCDFRGQLLSAGPAPASIVDHVDDLVGMLDDLDRSSVHVAGTSFGGVVGTLLASHHPERVRSLVTIASGDGFDEEMADEVARWKDACRESLDGQDRGHLYDVLEPVVYSTAYLEAHAADRAERRRQISRLPDAWFEGLIGLLGSARSLRLGDELRHIRCPVLVLAAEHDVFVPRDRACDLAGAIPGARFAIIEGAGHAAVVERPDAVTTAIRDFIARL
jgi:3-oxoadipate enol-lactonase